MGIIDKLRGLDRTKWFVCYDCMGRQSERPENAIFFYDGAPHVEHGRNWWKCTRCESINTRSFQFLKENGEDTALYGLERVVKSHPREHFLVEKKPA
jgi:hypothetical protein